MTVCAFEAPSPLLAALDAVSAAATWPGVDLVPPTRRPDRLPAVPAGHRHVGSVLRADRHPVSPSNVGPPR